MMRANKTPQDYHDLAAVWGHSWIGDMPKNQRTKTLWRCLEGHEWSAAYPYLRRCKICVGKAKKTEQDYHDLAQAYGLEWLGPEVVSTQTKTWWRCLEDHKWETTYNRIRNGANCRYCSYEAKKNPPQAYHDLAQTHGFEWLGPEVANGQVKTWWRCKNRHEWEVGYNRLRGCPRCFESKGELRITSVLKVLDIHVIPQQSFETCRYKQPLRFDFYIPTYNLLIEYQGEGHFMTIWGKDQLRNTQRNDKIKADWAQQNGFELLPINYWEYERIAETLADKLQGYATSEYYKQGRLI